MEQELDPSIRHTHPVATARLFVGLTRLWCRELNPHPFSEYQWQILKSIMYQVKILEHPSKKLTDCSRSYFEICAEIYGVYGPSSDNERLHNVLLDLLNADVLDIDEPGHAYSDSSYRVATPFIPKWRRFICEAFNTIRENCAALGDGCVHEYIDPEQVSDAVLCELTIAYLEFAEDYTLEYFRCLTWYIGKIVAQPQIAKEATELKKATAWVGLTYVYLYVHKIEGGAVSACIRRDQLRESIKQNFPCTDDEIDRDIDNMERLTLIRSSKNKEDHEDARRYSMAFELKERMDRKFIEVAGNVRCVSHDVDRMIR